MCLDQYTDVLNIEIVLKLCCVKDMGSRGLNISGAQGTYIMVVLISTEGKIDRRLRLNHYLIRQLWGYEGFCHEKIYQRLRFDRRNNLKVVVH